MALISVASIDHHRKKELRSRGIQSQSKLLSLKYLFQASLEKQNRNPSSLKCVHFINSIVVLNKESEAMKEENMRPNTTMGKDHNITIKAKDEVKEESEEEFEEETEEETEKEEEDDPEYFDMFPIVYELRYHKWLLKNPRPPWVNAKIKTGNIDNIKIECMIG
nr:hypothetical protein [Tanacetum cinerariifolium]